MTDNLLHVAQQHLRRVKRSGSEDIMAVCPFHRKSDGTEERSPSFAMNIYNGLWYCHSCHASGNLVSFLRNVGLSRAEIDLQYGFVLKDIEKYTPPAPTPLDIVESTEEPLEESFLGLFDQCPQMLLDEDYPMELLQKFDIGFDEKHMRVTFPLRDSSGRLVGISGRSVDGAIPRYKVYDREFTDFGLPRRKTEKRTLLWNFHNVRARLQFETDPSDRYIVVTEGFKAVMRVAQAGISNVVGILGSHLSREQQWLLERFSDCPIFLMLDSNDAGQRGQYDAAYRLHQTVTQVYVVQYDAPQPSELPLPAIRDALLEARPASLWLIQQAAARPQ